MTVGAMWYKRVFAWKITILPAGVVLEMAMTARMETFS